MEQAAIEIIKQLKSAGHEALFVGGYVRDKLLHRISTGDIDIATSAIPSKVLELFPNSKYVGESFGVVLVKIDDYSFEVATFRKDMGTTDGRHPDKVEFTQIIEEDALRRDFTINALYYDPITDKVFDYVNGCKDLEQGIIRFVGEPFERINEDCIRMIRAIRFAARFGFELDCNAEEGIIERASDIEKLVPERIFSELNKLFLTADIGKAILLLDNFWLLDEIFPEITALEKVEEPIEFHPEGNTLNHTLQVMQNIPFGAPLHLAYAALFHDIGKSKTKGYSKNRITHHGHADISAEMAKIILKRLKADNKLIDNTTWLISKHMAFKNVQKMKKSKLKKFIAHPLFYDLLQLHYADCMGSNKHLDNYNFMIRKLSEINVADVKKEIDTRLITGEDIKPFCKPGPIYKIILDKVQEKVLNDEIVTKEEAINYVKDYFVLRCERKLGIWKVIT